MQNGRTCCLRLCSPKVVTALVTVQMVCSKAPAKLGGVFTQIWQERRCRGLLLSLSQAQHAAQQTDWRDST